MGNKQPGSGGGATRLPAPSSSKSKQQHFDLAAKTGVLSLKSANLRELPDEAIVLAPNLRNVDISGNRIEVVPDFIGQFRVLKQFRAESNSISSLPNEFGALQKLEILNFASNRIGLLPSTFCSLSNLKSVDLSGNRFTEFPVVICQLEKLDALNLAGNKIETVPDEVAALNVTELNLNQNRLHFISEKIAECSRLKVLRVEENCLTLHVFTKVILSDSQISLIAGEGNLFDTKDMRDLEGYEDYSERFTATKKKMF